MPAPRQQTGVIPISRQTATPAKGAPPPGGYGAGTAGRQRQQQQQQQQQRGNRDQASVQQPPWKSSLEVAWSYSRSQANLTEQRNASSPSFTESHWAGPQGRFESEDDEDDDDEDVNDGDDDELDVDAETLPESADRASEFDVLDGDDIEDGDGDIGIVHVPTGGFAATSQNNSHIHSRAHSHAHSHAHSIASTSKLSRLNGEQDMRHRDDVSRQPIISLSRDAVAHRPAFPRSASSPSAPLSKWPKDRRISRLTSEEDEADERSRSRSRSPKRVAASSSFFAPMGAGTGTRVNSDGSRRGRPMHPAQHQQQTRPPHAYHARSSSGLAAPGSSDVPAPRVGSHYERYSIRSSSRDRQASSSFGSDDEDDGDDDADETWRDDVGAYKEGRRLSPRISPARGRTRQAERIDETTPLMARQRTSTASTICAGGRPERGRSRSTARDRERERGARGTVERTNSTGTSGTIHVSKAATASASLRGCKAVPSVLVRMMGVFGEFWSGLMACGGRRR